MDNAVGYPLGKKRPDPAVDLVSDVRTSSTVFAAGSVSCPTRIPPVDESGG